MKISLPFRFLGDSSFSFSFLFKRKTTAAPKESKGNGKFAVVFRRGLAVGTGILGFFILFSICRSPRWRVENKRKSEYDSRANVRPGQVSSSPKDKTSKWKPRIECLCQRSWFDSYLVFILVLSKGERGLGLRTSFPFGSFLSPLYFHFFFLLEKK